MAREIKYIELLDIDTTEVDWWKRNRERLNELIVLFNTWQVEHKFDEHYKEAVKARIKSLRVYGSENSFSDWQFDLLSEMENWCNKN